MREISTEELKAIQLSILDDVAHFCDAHGIRYSLAYGTLLGAVRHGGYIPWDDDIDLFMPRPDYDLFLSTYTSCDNEVIDLSKKEDCIEMFGKVCRKNTIMEDTTNSRKLWGIYIDIFPVDGLPEGKAQSFYDAATAKWNQIPRVCPFYRSMTKHRGIWFFKYVLKKVLFFKYGNVLTIKSSLSIMLKSGDYYNSKLAGCYFGDAGRDEFMDKTIFEEYCMLPFEGKRFSAPAQYDKYLKNLFGDYMQLPPPEERVSHHLYHSYILD